MTDFWRAAAPAGSVWPPVDEPEPTPDPRYAEVPAAEALLERTAEAEAEPAPPAEELDDDEKSGPRFPGAHPLARYDWPSVKARYVEGVKDPKTGVMTWPSIREAAEAFDANPDRARERSAAEGWVEQRRQYQARVEATRQQARAAALAKQGLTLEGKALDAANLGLQLVQARLMEIARAAQAARADGVGDGGGRTGIDATEQQKLAAAADLWHRIGLRAIGDPQTTRVELTGAGGAPIEIAQELRRDDPTRIASVVAVLKRAGLGDTFGSGDDDVVDGEVAEDDAGDGAESA